MDPGTDLWRIMSESVDCIQQTMSQAQSGILLSSLGTQQVQRTDRCEPVRPELEAAITTVLTLLGEDVEDGDTTKTPARYAQALMDLTSGKRRDLTSMVSDALIATDSRGMVVIKGISVFSLCKHHMLPFSGKVHIAYMPHGHVLGLSKFVRIVRLYAQRLQIQEQLTEEIANAIKDTLQPLGVVVSMNCTHFCMVMRGVCETTATTTTEHVSGVFGQSQTLLQRAYAAFDA